MRQSAVILFVTVWLVQVALVQAQEAPSRAELAEAQRLFGAGVDLADAERWGEAAEYFRRARAIVERPSIVCNLGVALHHVGEASAAVEALLRCQALAREDEVWGRANEALVERTDQLLADLIPAMGHLTLTLEPPDAEVTIDGELAGGHGSPRTFDLDPGSHRVTVGAPGFVSRSAEVSVLSGSEEELRMPLEALPSVPAVLVVESVDGARIFLDDEEIGVGHAERELAPRTYRLRIAAAGHDDFTREVRLDAGEHSTIEATFGARGTDLAAEPGLWIGVGAGVLIIAGAIALGVVLGQPEYAGTTNVTLVPLMSF